ncbi:MAG: hypothetical protein ACTHJT_00645 [Cytophaga sp.]|uniref:hypothetical protein n=1 Tax=Cytophaga sp. TaxID=29535 RepID=UPI003F7F49DE
MLLSVRPANVLGQIAYKKGCIETVIEHLKTWENKELVLQALDEIIDVHGRYKDFAILTQEETIKYIDKITGRRSSRTSSSEFAFAAA